MNLDQLKSSLLKKPSFRKEYYKKDLAFEVAQMVLEARGLTRLSQAELAELIGTKQPSIARVENGHLPTLAFLEKLAKAMGTYLIPPKFGFFKDKPLAAYDNFEKSETATKYASIANYTYTSDIDKCHIIQFPQTVLTSHGNGSHTLFQETLSTN